MRLSDDHKPDRRDERKRITDAGGLVVEIAGIWRVGSVALPSLGPARRTLLSVSRAFGDVSLKTPSPLVVCMPEVTAQPLDAEDLLIILACDGVWDVLSDQEAVAIALEEFGDPRRAAAALVRTAHQRGSEDNLTATVVVLPWRAAAVPPALVVAQAEAEAHPRPQAPSRRGPAAAEVVTATALEEAGVQAGGDAAAGAGAAGSGDAGGAGAGAGAGAAAGTGKVPPAPPQEPEEDFDDMFA